MAESSSGDKTEKPSQQKLKKSREQGQVARSRDWATAAGIVISLQLFLYMMPGYMEDFRLMFRQSFASLDGEGAMDNVWSNLFMQSVFLIVKMVAPLLLVPFLVVAANLFPGGWAVSVGNLAPKPERLSPMKNLGRLFGGRHWAEFGTSLMKAGVLIAVLWHVVQQAPASYMRLQSMTMDRAIVEGASLMRDGITSLVVVFVVFALLDVPMQVFFFMKQQRMSKQEVKDEHKTQEGRPEVKQRVRQLQQQMAKRSLSKAVPGADVVIVNPEHYAVALKYDGKRADAPFLVAKGVDEMALYIRELAAKHGVKVVPLPPLARAIYNTSQVNQQIPAALYKAVAQVLGYVMQLDAFQAGRRKSAPALPVDLDVPAHLT